MRAHTHTHTHNVCINKQTHTTEWIVRSNDNNNNNNERISRPPFHVKHAQLRWTSVHKNTKHMHIRHPKQQVSKQSTDISLHTWLWTQRIEWIVHVTVLKSNNRGSHILPSWMVQTGCVFVVRIHLSRTWTSGSFESVWWNACVNRLDPGLYSHPNEFVANGVRTHVNSQGKILSTGRFWERSNQHYTGQWA